MVQENDWYIPNMLSYIEDNTPNRVKFAFLTEFMKKQLVSLIFFLGIFRMNYGKGDFLRLWLIMCE